MAKGLVMKLETQALAGDAEWVGLMALISQQQTALEAAFLEEFDGTVVYEGRVSRAEILTLVRNSMRMYLMLLSGESLPVELARLPAELGSRRAKQGVALEQLLEGVRTNSRVLWSALQQAALSTGAVECLVKNTGTLLNVVEWHIGEVQRAYFFEADRLDRERESTQRRAVAALFGSGATSGDDIHDGCRDLGIDRQSNFEVVVQVTGHDPDCLFCDPAHNFFVHESETLICHFRPVGIGVSCTEILTKTVAYFERVQGADALKSTAELGAAFLHLPRSREYNTPLTPDNTWQLIAWNAVTEVLPATLLPLNQESFSALPSATRSRLINTARTYIEFGSIKQTAEALFCHRNTVVQRLSMFEEHTGLAFSKPNDLALITLFLSTQ